MKKRLLLVALAMVSTVMTFAYEVGDYVFTQTQRFKVTAANIVTNGTFTDGFAGWLDADGNALATEAWGKAEGVGPNGEDALQITDATSSDAVCGQWTGLSGNYIVSIQVKGEVYTALSTTTGSNNYLDFFINTDGALVKATSTDEAPVIQVATGGSYTDEWTELNYLVSGIEDTQFLVMNISKLAANSMITNIGIYAVEEVYDYRELVKKTDFAKLLMDDPNFNTEAAASARNDLDEVIGMIELMLPTENMEDASTGASLEEAFAEAFKNYLDVTSRRMNDKLAGTDDVASLATIGRGGNLPASYANLDLQGGNWGHPGGVDYLMSAIQLGYDHTATYNTFHEDFPAGKYFFTAEIRNANTTKTSWPCDPQFNVETTCKMFIGSDSIDVTIAGEAYQRFYMIADIDEDGKFRAGVKWPGVGKGGAFFIKNVEVRAFGDAEAVVAKIDHVQAWKAYIAQWNAATNSRVKMNNLLLDENYVWGMDSIRSAQEKWDPYYREHRAKGWVTAEGTDAGIATTDELNDWAQYQGVELYNEEGTRLTFQLVRGYQYTVSYVEGLNKPFIDLANAIDEAKANRNKAVNTLGDRDAFKTAILAAINTINTVRSTTTDATREADAETLTTALNDLNTAYQTFLASRPGSITMVDIDFSNPFELLESGEYAVKGAQGEIVFSSVELDPSANSTAFMLGYQPEGGEVAYGDVLRVGNGTGTVMLASSSTDAETQETEWNYLYPENAVVTAQFDLWFGNLISKNCYVDLMNAAGQRIAGFSINRYNGSLAYNDFGDGFEILKYATGVGSSSASNAAICADNNRTSFTLVVNYEKGTMQAIMSNPQKGTCTGAEISIPEMDDARVAKFVVGSNYNNNDRRSWFDNLKIVYSASGQDMEEDINDTPWAPTSINEVKADSNVKAGIYTISGVKVNSKNLQKGLYIINGKKFVVK